MARKGKIEDKGAIGIGTLIVFIALILVAAIAAAVIIGTAEDLEEKAEQAGRDAERLVEATIWVDFAEGNVDATSNEMDEVYLYIKAYGSEGVNMQDVVIHAIATPYSGTAVSADIKFNPNGDHTSAQVSGTEYYFGTEEILDPLNQYDVSSSPESLILGERAQLKLTLDLSLYLTTLSEDSDLEFLITVTTSGHLKKEYYSTPAAYPPSGIVRLED